MEDTIERFKVWAESLTPKVEKEKIEEIQAKMEAFDGGGIFHNYTPEGIQLRTRIQKVLHNIEKQKEEGGDCAIKQIILSAFLADAAKIIKAEAGVEVSPFELAAALRFRFVLSFDEDLQKTEN